MNALARSIGWFKRLDAPVLVQEMRVRQRGVKPFIVMFVYLTVLSAIAMLTLYFMTLYVNSQNHRDDMSEVGQMMFIYMSFAQLVMVLLIVPAYGSASVSGERERGTFDLLALTLLPSSGIVTQKLVAAIAQALMLIVASVPVLGIVFLIGGVSPLEVLVAYALLVVTAMMLGAFGVLCSCCARSSRVSTFLTYLIAFSFFAGVPIGGEWLRSVSRRGFNDSLNESLLMFALMFAFVGGVASLLVYAPLSLWLSRRSAWWRTRAFRMGVFGGVYVLLVLLLTTQAGTDTYMLLYQQDIFLPLFVNPFAALFFFVDRTFSMSASYGIGASLAYWMVGATIVFSIGCTVIFRHISSARFAGLRRS